MPWTDGFGRSDSRQHLRSLFEVDRYYVTVEALRALADEGRRRPVRVDIVQAAIATYGIDTGKRSPMQDQQAMGGRGDPSTIRLIRHG